MTPAADQIADPARELAVERARLERALDQVEKCRARIRQIENGGTVKAKAGELDGEMLMAQTISAAQAAERTGRSQDTIVRWCIQHGIGVKCGWRWRIYPDRLRKLIS
jgi:hypothetical protein